LTKNIALLGFMKKRIIRTNGLFTGHQIGLTKTTIANITSAFGGSFGGSMSKKATMSNEKHPEDCSKKDCVCGGHQGKRGKKKPKVNRKTIRRAR